MDTFKALAVPANSSDIGDISKIELTNERNSSYLKIPAITPDGNLTI